MILFQSIKCLSFMSLCVAQIRSISRNLWNGRIITELIMSLLQNLWNYGEGVTLPLLKHEKINGIVVCIDGVKRFLTILLDNTVYILKYLRCHRCHWVLAKDHNPVYTCCKVIQQLLMHFAYHDNRAIV